MEKDISSAMQEWYDILPPGVQNVEMSYVSLSEKENELANEKREKERLKFQLEENNMDNAYEKEKLRANLREKEQKIENMRKLVEQTKLDLERDFALAMNVSKNTLIFEDHICSNCDKTFQDLAGGPAPFFVRTVHQGRRKRRDFSQISVNSLCLNITSVLLSALHLHNYFYNF